MLCLKQMGDTAASPPGDDLRLAAGDSASDEERVDGADGGEPAAGGGGRRHNNTLARALCGLLASLADRLKCGRQNRKRQVRGEKGGRWGGKRKRGRRRGEGGYEKGDGRGKGEGKGREGGEGETGRDRWLDGEGKGGLMEKRETVDEGSVNDEEKEEGRRE